MRFQVCFSCALYTLAAAGAIGTNHGHVRIRSAAKLGTIRKLRKEYRGLGLNHPPGKDFGHASAHSSTRENTFHHSTLALIDGESAAIELAHVTAQFDNDTGQENGLVGAKASMMLRRAFGTCKVPKHGENVWGSMLGASERMCYGSLDELQQGEACRTACAKWYKTPYPSRVWCSCDPVGDGCTLQPVVDSADESPVMMSYLRCPISFLRMFAVFTPCCLFCCGFPMSVALAIANQRKKQQQMKDAKTQTAVVTSLTEFVFAGSTQLRVASQEGFEVGSKIKIFDAVNAEINTIAAFGSLIVATPLVNSYSAGAFVMQMHGEEQRAKPEVQAHGASEATAKNIEGGFQVALQTLLLEVKQSPEEIVAVFKSFDIDGNGALDITEFGQALRKLGYTGDVSVLFSGAKWSSDKKVDYEEFLAALQADSGVASFPPYSRKPAPPWSSAGAAPKTGITPLIFVHGVFGSHLAQRNDCSLTRFFGRVVNWGFLTSAQAAGFKTADISLPLTWQNGRQDYQPNPYIATGVIEEVAGVGFYRPILNWLQSHWGDDYHEFVYDWRRDNNESADLLIRFIERVVQSSGGSPAIIVAHSNGGLLTMAALNERPELIHSVVFCAAALGPSLSAFHLLHKGSMNITPSNACSHPSYYCFLVSHPDAAAGGATPWSAETDPDGSKVFWNPRIQDSQGNDLNLMDASVWEKHKIGGLWQNASEDDYGLIRSHLTNALAAAERLRNRTVPRSEITYPPLRAVESKNQETTYSWIVDGGGGIKILDRGPGDGRVPWGAGRPGGGISCPVLETKYSHGTVPNDLHVVSRALLEVIREQELRCSKSGAKCSNVPKFEEVPPKEPDQDPSDNDNCNIL